MTKNGDIERYNVAQSFDRDANGYWVRYDDHLAELESLNGEIERLREALDSVRQYGSDTLSGRADGPDDRAWQREAVREMTKRAREALAGRAVEPEPKT